MRYVTFLLIQYIALAACTSLTDIQPTFSDSEHDSQSSSTSLEHVSLDVNSPFKSARLARRGTTITDLFGEDLPVAIAKTRSYSYGQLVGECICRKSRQDRTPQRVEEKEEIILARWKFECLAELYQGKSSLEQAIIDHIIQQSPFLIGWAVGICLCRKKNEVRSLYSPFFLSF